MLAIKGMNGSPSLVLDAPNLTSYGQEWLLEIAEAVRRGERCTVDSLAMKFRVGRDEAYLTVKGLQESGYIGLTLAKPLKWKEVRHG